MKGGVNRVTIIGRLGADPETRYTKSNDPVVTVSVATSESWTDKTSGEKREQTEWHRVVFWRRLAEVVQQYLHKGDAVYIEGQLKTRKWQDNTGADRYTTEIQAREMQMLGGGGQGQGQGGGNQYGTAGGPGPGSSNAGGYSGAASPQTPGQAANHARNAAQDSGGRPDFDDDVPF